MFNPGKQTKDIRSFYVDLETNLPVEEEKRIVNFRNLCRPDMHWITEKCMMRSAEYRQMLEGDQKARMVITNEIILKDQELYKKYKKRLLAPLGNSHNIEIPVLHTTFMNCSALYDQECRKFYETRRSDEKFTMI